MKPQHSWKTRRSIGSRNGKIRSVVLYVGVVLDARMNIAYVLIRYIANIRKHIRGRIRKTVVIHGNKE